MKQIIIALSILFFANCLFAQNDLRKIDSTLSSINENVISIKDQVVKEKTKPFTGQSLFEDRKGNSAIFLPEGGTFRLNTADASLKLSFTNYGLPIVGNKPKPYFGFEISGKTNDDIFSLFSNGNISPGAKVLGIAGIDIFNKTKNRNGDDVPQKLGRLTLKLGYEGSSFKLFTPDSIFENQIHKTSFNSFTTSLSFNLKIGGNKLFGVSVGFNKANNYDDLTKMELNETKFYRDTINNITRTTEKKINVRSGEYKVYDQIPISLDFFWVPKNNPRLGFYHYWRTKITEKTVTNGFGSGFYLLKKNNPLSSIAGIVFEVSDISKLNDGFSKNFTINFVVGFNFGFYK